jgi:hypothetical protein
MKAYEWSGGRALLILNLGATWRSVVKILPQLLYPRGKTLVPINEMLGGLWSWYGPSGEEKNLLLLPGFKPWIIQPVA